MSFICWTAIGAMIDAMVFGVGEISSSNLGTLIHSEFAGSLRSDKETSPSPHHPVADEDLKRD